MGQTVNLLAYAFGGSNPSLPTKNCGSSSVDRALAFQAEGRGFEPRLPLSKENPRNWILFFIYFRSPKLWLSGNFRLVTLKLAIFAYLCSMKPEQFRVNVTI